MQESGTPSRLAHCEREIVRLRRTVRMTTTISAVAMIALLAGFAVPRAPMTVFAADSMPGSGAALRLWTNKSWVEMKSDEGGPHFSASRDDHVVFSEPPANDLEQGAFCRELKQEVAAIPKAPSAAEVLAACRAHRTEKECTLCLGKP
jgi:hypothetical protein